MPHGVTRHGAVMLCTVYPREDSAECLPHVARASMSIAPDWLANASANASVLRASLLAGRDVQNCHGAPYARCIAHVSTPQQTGVTYRVHCFEVAVLLRALFGPI